MDKRISQARGCDALNTIAQETQCNVQTLPPKIKQCGYKSLKSPNCLNYYDGLFCASTEIKEEFPCPQSSTAASCTNKSGIDSNIYFENEELSKVPETQEIKQEVSEEALSFIKTEEIHDEKDKFIAKTEMTDEYRIPSNAGDTSVLYKVWTSPQEIQPTTCGGILKNGFNLSTLSNEHIITEPLRLVSNEGDELHKCQCCDEYFNHDHMLAHVEDVHSHKKYKCERYNESIKKIHAETNVDDINYKCDFCKRIYKSKSALVSHLKKVHYVYGRIFECWCGEQFRTPRQLYKHKNRQHDAKAKSTYNTVLKTELQCEICKKMFKRKGNLKRHITSIHYDYGKTFDCGCGKQFRTPLHLNNHKKRIHDPNITSTNNAALKAEFQCDICKKMFKYKDTLKQHILSTHYDYSKTFECQCGKQFRTPRLLYKHKNRQHDANAKRINNAVTKIEFQCDICKKMFKSKCSLKRHITSIHYDYSKTFEFWCGKQFRTTRLLYKHKNRQHDANDKCINNAIVKIEFQCDICKKMFKRKGNLKRHIINIHYDYSKTFECWCRKQFRTPIHLNNHKKRIHEPNIKSTNNAALITEFQCDICKKMFKYKHTLKQHILSTHYDYSKTFECWCGKQFRTPRLLYKHKNRQHDANTKRINNAVTKIEFQCDICKKMFKRKSSLKRHITSIHYDYSKTFECWCGKQFHTQIHLNTHKKRIHDHNIKRINNAALKIEFQCDICKKMFKSKCSLKRHITSIHYDYNKTFECWCGKQFSTPRFLYKHKNRQHGASAEGTNNAALKTEFQCDICKKKFKSKCSLKRHITTIHYDYSKTFECWCGKQFRTPIHLNNHKKRIHNPNIKSTNNAAFKTELQCDICKRMFKYKDTLKQHILCIHCDYNKAFECWCGKQFRTSIYLYKHKSRQHGDSVKSTNNAV